MNGQAHPLLSLLAIVAAIFVIGVLWRILGRGGLFTIVYEWDHALAYVDGRFERILPPGRHLNRGFRHRSIFTLRKSELFLATPPVDVTSADRLAFRLAATINYRIDDPRQAYENPHVQKLSLATSSALIKAAAARSLEAFLLERPTVDAEILAMVGSSISGCAVLGVTISAVTLPPEVRRLFSEVERARLEGAAALERARGEQASLRSLANAARMLKGNPELMNLRVLQAVSPQGKAQGMLVLGQPALLPVSRSAETGE